MSQQKIELSGIVRNLPDNTVKDGTMHELINLRPKDGALRPVGAKAAAIYSTPDVRFIHKVSDSIKVLIGVDSSNALLYEVYINDIFIQSVHEFSITPNLDMSFACLKNSLMLTNNVTEEITLMIFNEDTNLYSVFHDYFLPNDMPGIFIQRLAVPADNVPAEVFSVGPETDYGEAMLSQYVKMQKEKGDAGYLSGKILVRIAWELFDGTMVKHTIPILTSTSEITTTAAYSTTALNGTSPGWIITTVFNAYSLQFNISSTLQYIYNKYKNIIRSMRIYVSLPKSPEAPEIGDIHLGKMSLYIGGKSYQSRYGTLQGYDVENLKNYEPDPETELYFLLKEYTIEDIESDPNGIGLWRTISLNTIQDLATRDQLPVDNFSHHQLFAKSLFAYNERIFLGNVKNNLSTGFLINDLVFNSNGTPGDDYDVGIEYDIVTSQGTRTVFSGWKTLNTYDIPSLGHARFQVGYTNDHFIGYPDSRAKVMRILMRRTAAPTIIYLYFEFTLTSVPAHNFSYYRGFLVQFPTAFTTKPITALSTRPAFYWDYNRIQATELNNPFYYPAINSYRVGLGSILGMSSNAIALSSGQFGQFPIYVFTTDGVWTMSIGTGENLINTITPLAREVCNNPRSITPIDGGSAFTSGKGLFIVSGNQVIEISIPAEGSHTSRITSNADLALILAEAAYAGTLALLCSRQFLAYMAGAVIGYDYINRELIVSNDTDNYSWVYSLDYKTWFKISQTFRRFINDFPITYGVKVTGTAPTFSYPIQSINAENFTLDPLVHAETRPLKLSASVFKKLHRLMLEGNVINDPTYPFQIVVFGTNDGKTWVMLNSRGMFNTDDTMILGRSQFSCKYFIVVFGGHVKEGTLFTNLFVDSEDRYNNKLR